MNAIALGVFGMLVPSVACFFLFSAVHTIPIYACLLGIGVLTVAAHAGCKARQS
jgi:hypothetical protein